MVILPADHLLRASAQFRYPCDGILTLCIEPETLRRFSPPFRSSEPVLEGEGIARRSSPVFTHVHSVPPAVTTLPTMALSACTTVMVCCPEFLYLRNASSCLA